MRNLFLTKFLCFVFFVLFAKQSIGQQLNRQMLSSMGSTSTTKTGLVVLQTVGQQSVIGTWMNSSILVQQGFQQSLISTFFPLSNINTVSTTIYPNPFRDKVFVNFSELIPGEMTVDLFNMFGVVVFNQRIKDPSLNMNYNFDFLPAGSYVIQIKANNYLFTKTLIKQ